MRATEVYAKCVRAGVKLETQGDRLRLYGPKAALTRELQSEVKAHKSGLLELLRIMRNFHEAGFEGSRLVLN